MLFNSDQCGNLLALWLGEQSSPDNVKILATDLGYEDTPFFGANEKTIEFTSELVIVNTMLVLFAVHQVFDLKKARIVIDFFLSNSKSSLFRDIEQQDPNFEDKYDQRSAQYRKILQQGDPLVILSTAFLANLSRNLRDQEEVQEKVTATFAQFLKKTIDVLELMDLGV